MINIIHRDVLRGGVWGLSPSPGPIKSIDFRGFQNPTGAEPPWIEKKISPPLDKFLNTPLLIQLKELHEKAIKKERLTEEDRKLLQVYQISQVIYKNEQKPF